MSFPNILSKDWEQRGEKISILVLVDVFPEYPYELAAFIPFDISILVLVDVFPEFPNRDRAPIADDVSILVLVDVFPE